MVFFKIQAILFPFLLLCVPAHAQKVFFVEPGAANLPLGTQSAPYASIHQAIKAANSYWKTEDDDVVIYIKPGKYAIEKPIVISHETLSNKKPKARFTLAGYGSPAPVISGGIKITTWQREGNNLYTAHWNKKPFRQLYLNGEKLVRAREPDCYYHRLSWDVDNKKIIVPQELQQFDFQRGETEIFIQKIWSCQIFRIGGSDYFEDYTELRFLPEDEIVFSTRSWQIKDGTSFHLENNFQFLDTDNEWYLDRNSGKIYLYKPRIEANKFQAEAPHLDNLLLVRGDTDEKLENIKISNLTFENTNWTLPDSVGLYAGQATYIYNLRNKQPKNGTVVIENAVHIEFSNNTIRNAGGNALMLYHNLSHAKITGNSIHDIAGNGIVIDWNLNKNLDSGSYCHHVEVNNNLITRIGRDYFGSVGIVTGYAYDLRIERNFLYNLPYSGISVGWGHTYDDTSLKNIIVEYNYIGNAMNRMSDGGGIYTLSNQPGTVIANNFIENIIQSKWSLGRNHVYGIYLDEGSHNISVTNNRFGNVTEKFVSNSPKGVNNVNLHREISLAEFQKANELYRDYDSLRSFLFKSHKCADFLVENPVFIVPNPVRTEFYIIADTTLSEIISYEIYSVEGRKVAGGTATLLKDKVYFSRLPAKLKTGVYLFRIFYGNSYYTQKILVGG